MKIWKIVVISVITTASLVTIGATTYNYLKPVHYKGDTFTNSKTSISTTTYSTSVSSSTESIEDTNSSNNTNPVYTESNSTEQVTEYNTLWVYASSKGYCDRDGNKINRSGFYVLTPIQNHTNYVEVIEIDMRTNDEYHIKVYGETDEINDINYQSACANAESFCNWLREQAPEGHTTYGLQSNYDYWVNNCNNKYH